MAIDMVDLSDNILENIFKELRPKDLLNVRQVRHGILTHEAPVENIQMTSDLQASWETVALEGHMDSKIAPLFAEPTARHTTILPTD